MMKKVNVLHIVEDLKIGGMERIIATIVTDLNKGKYNISLWCLARGGQIASELQSKGINIEILGMEYHHSPLFFLKLARRMKQAEVDILHAHGYTATTVGRLAAIFAGIPLILSHSHTSFEKYTKRQIMMEKILHHFTDRIICCSQSVAQSVKDYARIKSNKLVVIYNGVEKSKFTREIETDDLRKQFSLLAADDYVVGCIASFRPHKGHKYLLQAAQIISKSQLPKSQVPKFLLVGDGPLRKSLEEYALALGINSKIIFTGIREDISKILSIMDIVVLPSCQWEGLGISLLETMAEGKPVIGTKIGGIPEVIKTGETGILVAPRDSQALAEAIIYLLGDKERRKKMGLAGGRLYEERFTARIMLQKIEELYSFLVKEKIG